MFLARTQLCTELYNCNTELNCTLNWTVTLMLNMMLPDTAVTNMLSSTWTPAGRTLMIIVYSVTVIQFSHTVLQSYSSAQVPTSVIQYTGSMWTRADLQLQSQWVRARNMMPDASTVHWCYCTLNTPTCHALLYISMLKCSVYSSISVQYWYLASCGRVQIHSVVYSSVTIECVEEHDASTVQY